MKVLSSILEDKDIPSKEYIDTRLDLVLMLTAESTFITDIARDFHQYEFDYICIEKFDSPGDIDSSVDDGAYVLANFYDEDRHVIDKTSQETRVIQSRTFSIDSTPYKALVRIDYDGVGDISAEISKNAGGTWFPIQLDTLTDLNALVQRNVRFRLTMTGQVRLKNLAWGTK